MCKTHLLFMESFYLVILIMTICGQLLMVMELNSIWMLIALPYLRNNAHVRLIVPSKMGHTTAQQYVNPYFYDIRKFEKAKS